MRASSSLNTRQTRKRNPYAPMLKSLRRYFSRFAPARRKGGYAPLPGYSSQYWLQTPGKPVWTSREFTKFSEEAYIRNVIAHRAVSMVATAAANVPWLLFRKDKEGAKHNLSHHPLLSLLGRPNPNCAGAEFFEAVYAYKLISGNSYIQLLAPNKMPVRELYVLRPDRVQVIAGKDCLPAGYRYTVGSVVQDFVINQVTGETPIIHLKQFHPLNDWYGLSAVEPAAYSIDQHNHAGEWNQALLQNGARPSGALVMKNNEGVFMGGVSDDQFRRLRSELDEQFAGAMNSGRPLLLEGGLEWKEMSLSPKDMDFIEMKHSAARDIALAFGVPPQLLGIPGDNTYSNLAEARLALWEQTILPLLDHVVDALNHWLVPRFGNDLVLAYDENSISALSLRREKLWERLEGASFLTVEEKRKAAGLG